MAASSARSIHDPATCETCAPWHGHPAAVAAHKAAVDAVAQIKASPTTSVTLDRGGGLDGRIHIDWCLRCQRPLSRCSCGELPS